jgi:Polyketide cyclase / dehydrase and lipid transport
MGLFPHMRLKTNERNNPIFKPDVSYIFPLIPEISYLIVLLLCIKIKEMNILVNILLVIAAIAAILLIIALFTKKEYSVEREITIARPKQAVFAYIKLLKNQDNFSKWATMDPDMKKEYQGIDGTVGFVSSWESENKKVGKGTQEIIKITEGERVDFKLHFIIPFEGIANAYMRTASIGENQTIVKWGFDSSMKYPMNLMLLFMNMENMVGNDFATGLSNLKDILEKQ